ncbi:BON domain-containing protein [Azospirillum sp. TSH100]|uniref:BON domain-containing protein n=1 Tax=Azospirillum sp. TSH100 TaxID=652764 RepID=UPI000D68F8A9|nr:BON domain-containing protein [Azospirillum sp. TSH100]QCG92033.1 BON domain-containing protein [Azospirillum sp. TSH100]
MHRHPWSEEFVKMSPQGRYRGVGPRNYRRSDERILEDINERLTDDHHIDASDIGVRVEGGEVTLSGTVTDRAARRRAEDIAESVSGVGHVQNDLRVASRNAPGRSTSVGMGERVEPAAPQGEGSVTGPGAPARDAMVAALDNSSMVLGKQPLPEDDTLRRGDAMAGGGAGVGAGGSGRR